EHIISEIRRTASDNGGQALGRSRFAKETGIRNGDWERYWARWTDAVTEAGLSPQQYQGAHSDDHVLASVVAEIRRLGRIPVNTELRLRRRDDPTFPSHGAFDKLGGRAALIDRVIEYCGSHAEHADVLAIVEPLAVRRSPPERTRVVRTVV